MDITITFNIKQLRREKKITLRQLEQRSGISRSQISYIENNKTMPTIYVMVKLAIAMEVRVSDLYSVHRKK